MNTFDVRGRGLTAHGYLRAPFAFAAVALLFVASTTPLRAQPVMESATGAHSAGAHVSPDAGSGGSDVAPVAALRPVQQRSASHSFTLFHGDSPASTAPAFNHGLSTALNETAVRNRRSHTLAGAAAGLVIGAGATYLLLQQGGSRSLCNKDTNQDAIYARGCHGLYAVGGAVGAGVGALIGYRMGR